jgi:hypothetical protein
MKSTTNSFLLCLAFALVTSVATAQIKVTSSGIAGKEIIKKQSINIDYTGRKDSQDEKVTSIKSNRTGSGNVLSFVNPASKAGKSATIFYCYITYPGAGLTEGPAVSSTTNPTVINSLADQTGSNFLQGGTWVDDKWYGVEYTSNNLITIDTITGVRTTIGNTGYAMTGLAYDYLNSVLYAVGYDGANSSLYTINTTSGAATLVGICTADILINLACSKPGVLYTVSISDDNLYTINPSTGAVTLVGAIGFDANYAQDMEFDHNDETLYMAAYNYSSGAGELRTVDVGTGSTTLVGTFQGGSEITGLAIPNVPTYFTDDAKPISLIAPTSADLFTAADSVRVLVKNVGSNDITSGLSVSYSLDGGAAVTEPITGTLVSGASILHTFATTVDLSNPGANFDFVIYTTYAGDLNNANDTIYTTITNQWDVAPVSLDGPPIIGIGFVNPKATVENLGTINATFDVVMLISGGYTSTKTVTNLAPGSIQQVTFDPWNAVIGNYGVTIYTILPADSVSANDTITDSIQVMALTKVYCYVTYDPVGTLPVGPAITSLEYPSIITSLADQSDTNFVMGGTWANNIWYGVVNADNTLISIDTITGARTVVGITGKAFFGIAYNYFNSTLFGIEWDGAASNLYTINTSTGAATLVGTSTSQLLVNLACSKTGILYATGVYDDNLYIIDPNTGIASIIGYMGFDVDAFHQDMEFDHNSEQLYMAAVNGASSTGELRVVNVNTGATTLVGPFFDGVEITGMAIPGIPEYENIDAGVQFITDPSTGNGLTSAEHVVVIVANYGTTDITSGLSVSYILDGGLPVTEAISGTLAAGATITHTFAIPEDLSTPQAFYNLIAYTTLATDMDHSNDTISKSIRNTMGVYCFASGGCDEYISHVVFGTIDNTSGCSVIGYSNNTLIKTELGLVQTLPITVTNGSPYSTDQCGIWVDWNGNGDFGDAGDAMTVIGSPGNGPYTANISVPVGTSLGDKRIRIRITWSQTPVPCGTDDFGEVEDYTITVVVVTGSNDFSEKVTASLYPNPAKDKLNVICSSIIKNARITNLYGALISDTEINNSQFSLNTTSLGSGMYYLTLLTEQGTIVQKFIIE